MKINKLSWILALVLLVSIPAAFAQSGIFANPWVVFITNLLIVWTILFILVSFIPTQDNKVKVILWIATIVLAFVIVWYWGGRGDAYIWKAGALSTFFNIRILVNTIIIAGVAYFVAGFLGFNTTTKQGQIGLGILAIFIGVIVAINIGNEWLWDTSNVKALYDYLLGKEGILRYEKPHYRLFIFGISTLLFAWFFTSYLMPQGDKRLSWAIAFIVSANLAARGAPTDTIIALGEVFALLIIGKQTTQGAGWLGTIVGWTVAITITQFVFCTVFGKSGVVILLDATLGKIQIPYIGWRVFGWLVDWAKIPCALIAAKAGFVTGVTPPTTALPPGVAAPSAGGFNLWEIIKGIGTAIGGTGIGIAFKKLLDYFGL